MAHSHPLPTIDPMPGDIWLLASAMQKTIRRGEYEKALRAGYALWLKDRRRFWCRLLIISMEDVGVGDTDVLVQVLTGIASTSWRRQMGDAAAGMCLIRLLCGAAKSRLCDSIYIQASVSSSYRAVREQYAKTDDASLMSVIVDTNAPLVQRAMAIWLLAGTKKYPSDHMPPRVGNIHTAIAALKALSIPAALASACESVITRLPYPLPLHVPLILEEVQQHTVTVQHHNIPTASDVEGLPVYCADGFTRVGKACFRELQRVVPALQTFATKQIALGVFYLDGGLVDRELTAPGLSILQDAGEWADIESTGLSESAYAELRHILREHMRLLTHIRQKRLKEHLRMLRAGGGL